jgi:hypothetical protein
MANPIEIGAMYKICVLVLIVFGPHYFRELTEAKNNYDHGTKRCKRVTCDSWKHRLHALVMEEVSLCLAKLYKGYHGECNVVVEVVKDNDL